MTHEMAQFAALVGARRYRLSEHAVRNLVVGKIRVADIEAVLQNGVVLETHCHSTRGTSYLVCAHVGGRSVHVIWARASDGWLVVVFAYLPSRPVWKNARTRNDTGDRSMNATQRACFFCGGALQEITVGNFDYRVAGQLYVVKKVPAGLCQQCGEKYLDAEVAARLDALIAHQVFSGSEEVRVIVYDGFGL